MGRRTGGSVPWSFSGTRGARPTPANQSTPLLRRVEGPGSMACADRATWSLRAYGPISVCGISARLTEAPPAAHSRRRNLWTELTRRTFGFDVLARLRCAGCLRLVAPIEHGRCLHGSWGTWACRPTCRRVARSPPVLRRGQATRALWNWLRLRLRDARRARSAGGASARVPLHSSGEALR
jgi:hypothetical protein